MSKDYLCLACGKENVSYNDVIDAEITLGVKGYLCKGIRGRPKQACLEKAREGKCPGCGALLTGSYDIDRSVHAPALCKCCANDVRLGRAEREKPLGEKRWYQINTSFIPRSFGFSENYEDAVAAAILDLTSSARHVDQPIEGEIPDLPKSPYDRSVRFPVVELTEQQRDAVLRLAEVFPKLGAAIRRDGKREGEDVLGRLASGKLTVADYEEGRKKR